MKKFILWGGTGHAKVLHEALTRQDDRVVLIVDNRQIPSPVQGVPMVCGEQALDCWVTHNGFPQLYGLAAVGGTRGVDRLKIMELFDAKNIINYTLCHSSAFVAMGARIGAGSHILAQSAVGANVYLGRGVIVNTSASVDHDCWIADGVHIAPGATITGEVSIGSCAFIGAGAVILPRLCIGAHAVVGAGAVVTKNVQEKTMVVGNPAKCYSRQEKE